MTTINHTEATKIIKKKKVRKPDNIIHSYKYIKEGAQTYCLGILLVFGVNSFHVLLGFIFKYNQ